MAEQSTSGDPIAAFGPNEWLVDELYQQYLTDKNIGRQGLVGVLRGLQAAVTAGTGAAPAAARRRAHRRDDRRRGATAPATGRANGVAERRPATGARRPRRRPSRPGCAGRPAGTAPRQAAPAAPRPSRRGPKAEPKPEPKAAAQGRRPSRRAEPRSRATSPPSRAPARSTRTSSTPLRGAPPRVVANMEASLDGADRDQRARGARPSCSSTTASSSTTTSPASAAARSASPTSSATRWSRRSALMPEMNNGFAEKDGKPALVTPGPRQPRPRHRPAEARRHPHPRRADDQGGRGRWTSSTSGPPTRTSSRRARAQQADRRGLPGHDDLADQPGRHRHRALGAAADAGPGHDHRRRRAGVPGRVAGASDETLNRRSPSARSSR